MSFKVLMRDDNGELRVLHEIDDRRITRVGLSTRTGEAAGARIDADQTEVLLTFEWSQNDGRPTIQDVEARDHRPMTGVEVQERIDRLAELPSAQNTGPDTLMEAQRREQNADQERQQRTEDVDDSAVSDTSPTTSEGGDAGRDDGTVSRPSEGSTSGEGFQFGSNAEAPDGH